MTPTEETRFLAAIKYEGGCWIWQKSVGSHGYGQTFVGGHVRTAHRVAYEHWVGPIPPGRQVHHECDNRRCCNPDHLWIGTQRQNMADAWRKGRAQRGDQHNAKKTHCPKGHPYDEANTYWHNGKRRCRTCQRETMNQRYREHVNSDPKPVNAARTHCPQGHPYDEENTYRYPNGKRACRTCRRG